jgi:type IV pilus assembly protein PilV
MRPRRSNVAKHLRPPRAKGFSLVEVLVALIVTSVGLLGLAKMESLALTSTTVAGVRSIAAIQVASLAAMMHANQDFWQNPVVYASTTITSASNPYTGSPACTTGGATACSPTAMANYDLLQWGKALGQLLPVYSATITCSSAGVTAPYTCVITITWVENAVAMDALQSNLAGLKGPTYSMYVQP